MEITPPDSAKIENKVHIQKVNEPFFTEKGKETAAKVIAAASLSIGTLGMALLSYAAHSHALMIGSITLSLAGTYTSMLASRFLCDEKKTDGRNVT